MNIFIEPWSWIPHVEGADRQKEINAYLSRMVDEMPIRKWPFIKVPFSKGRHGHPALHFDFSCQKCSDEAFLSSSTCWPLLP